MDRYEAVAVILAIYLVVVALGHFMGLWKRIGAKVYGPVLIWRTRRGIPFIKRLARRERTWMRFASVGAVLAVCMMVIITLFLFWVSYSSPALPRAEAASEEVGPGLPTDGIVWTLVYGGLGITVAVFVHELGHGIVAASHRLRLDSVGILLVAIPVGAFVEPNDDDLDRAKASTVVKVYAAGAAANILAAIVCIAVLSWVIVPAAEPVEDGVIVTAVAPDSPGETFGVAAWSQVVGIGDDNVSDTTSFEERWFETPGGVISLTLRYGSERRSVLVPQGIVVTAVLDGPAENAGLREGMIIQSLNDTVIHSEAELRSVIENSTHQAPVPITVLVPGEDAILGDWFVRDETVVTVNLTSKWVWYYTHYNHLNDEEYKNLSFMGIEVAPFGLTVVDADHLTDLYEHPYAQGDEPEGLMDSTVRLLALPFIGYSPLIPPATDLYEPSGIASVLPDGAFWALANIVYWIFWGNVMLGFANAIPAMPFDGGYIFRSLLRWVLAYPRSRLKGIEKVTYQRRFTDPGEVMLVKVLTAAMTAATLVLVMWLILDPLI